MAQDIQPGSGTSLASLVSGIISDAQELIKQQVAMLRHEIKEDMRKTKEVATSMGVGVGIGILGVILLCFMLVYLLALIPGIALWAAFGIIGGILVIVGGILAYLGKKRFESFNSLADESAQALKENVEWITNPK